MSIATVLVHHSKVTSIDFEDLQDYCEELATVALYTPEGGAREVPATIKQDEGVLGAVDILVVINSVEGLMTDRQRDQRQRKMEQAFQDAGVSSKVRVLIFFNLRTKSGQGFFARNIGRMTNKAAIARARIRIANRRALKGRQIAS